MMLWIELGVVAGITALFVASAFFWLRPEDVDHDPLRVRIGAALQGLVIGALVGFVMLPLRVAFLFSAGADAAPAPAPPMSGAASLSLLPFVVLLIVVRRGLLARAPVIGIYLRAYRKAMLKRQIAGAQSALDRLTRLDAPGKT